MIDFGEKMVDIEVYQYQSATITDFGEQNMEDVLLDLLSIQNDLLMKFNIVAFNIRRTTNNNGLIIDSGHFVGIAYGSLVKLSLLPKRSLSGITIEHVMFMCLTGQTGIGFESQGDNDSLLSHCLESDALSGENLFALPFLQCMSKISNIGFRIEYKNQRSVTKGEIRGQIDLDKQALEHRPGLFHSSTTVGDINTSENQTLKYTLISLIDSNIFVNTIFESISLSIISELSDVDEITNDELNFECQSTISEPLYDQALNIAALIINGIDPSCLNSNVNPPSWVVDLNEVFERHVCIGLQNMNEYYTEVDEFPLQYQPHFSVGINVRISSNRHVLSMDERYIEPDGTYPEENADNLIIIDAKNKFNPNREGVLSILNTDLYQMNYYLQRLESNHGILIFPTNQKSRGIQRFLIDHSSHLITQYTLPITGTPGEILDKLRELAEYIHFANVEAEIHSHLDTIDPSYGEMDVNLQMQEQGIPRESQNQIKKISDDRILLRTQT